MVAPTAAEIATIVAAGARAPSGDNSQPWHLRTRGAAIEVTFDPERSRCGRFGHVAGLMAIGGLLESMEIAASGLGLRTVATRAHGQGSFLVRVLREPGQGSDLAAAIDERCTNRSPYEQTSLPWGTLDALLSEGDVASSVLLTSDPKRRAAVAGAAGLGERVRFDEVPMDDFQRWLRFSPEEAGRTRDGLDVRLLGLTVAEKLALRISGTRPGLATLRALGATSLAGRRAEQEVLASGAVGVITQAALTDDAFIASGRVLVRVWLRATRLGLAFGPAAAATLVPLSRHFGATFAPHHEAALDAVERTLRESFEIPQGRRPVFLFRVGSPTSLPPFASERRAPGAATEGAQ
jgi:nitroreductase